MRTENFIVSTFAFVNSFKSESIFCDCAEKNRLKNKIITDNFFIGKRWLNISNLYDILCDYIHKSTKTLNFTKITIILVHAEARRRKENIKKSLIFPLNTLIFQN